MGLEKVSKNKLNLTLRGRKRAYVQLLELWPLAKFHAKIWEFRKSARVSMKQHWDLCTFSVRGHFGVIWYTCHKMAHNWKTGVRREKLSEIWN